MKTDEQRIKELEQRVELLEKVITSAKGHTIVADVIGQCGNWFVLCPFNGGYKISRTKNGPWLPFKEFADAITHIQQNP